MAKIVFDDEDYKRVQQRLDAGLGMPRRVSTLEIVAPKNVPMSITRNAGKTMWTAIACVATINRVGEIDSTELFNNFVAYANTRGEYPDLIFHHLWSGLPPVSRMTESQKYNVEMARREIARLTNEPMANEMIVNGDKNHWQNFKLGKTTHVYRAGYTYVATGEFDMQNPFAQMMASQLEIEQGYWGTSIGYKPIGEPTLVRNGKTAHSVAVYNNGINHEISILPEQSAASVFTQVKSN